MKIDISVSLDTVQDKDIGEELLEVLILFFHSKIEADSAFMSANLPSSQYRVEKFEL